MILKGARICRWVYPFFGLTDKYRIKLHEMLFDLTYYGKFQYDAVYTMPVQYRSFYFNKLIKEKEREKADIDKANGKTEATSTKRGK